MFYNMYSAITRYLVQRYKLFFIWQNKKCFFCKNNKVLAYVRNLL